MRGGLALFFIFLSTMVFAQERVRVNRLFSCQDCNYEQVLQKLSSDSGLRFSYASSTLSTLNTDQLFTFDDESIYQVLNKVYETQGIDFKIIENNVVLRPSQSMSGSKALTSDTESIWLKGKVSGIVDDEASLPAATIMIKGSTRGTFADSDGSFEFEVPRALLNDTLEISYMGFKSSEYIIADIQDEFLMVKLELSDHMVTEIIVMNSAKPIRIIDEAMAMKLTNSHVLSSTGAMLANDINRSIQLLPGIAGHIDNEASVNIRGGGSDATFMVLDGMPIYNACHYFGVFSAVNAPFVDSVNVYRNIYPLEYNGGSAGMVEYLSQRNIPAKKELKLDLDLLTASAMLKLPIGNKSFLNLAARSTLRPISNDLFFVSDWSQSLEIVRDEFDEDIGSLSSNPACEFYDINATYLWQPSDKTQLRLHYFRSQDDYLNPFTLTISDRRDNEVDVNINESKKTSNNSFGFNLRQQVHDRIDFIVRSHLTDYQNDEVDFIDIDKKFKGSQGPPSKNPDGVDLGASKENSLLDYGAMLGVEARLPLGKLDLGIVSERKEIDYSFEENNDRILDETEEFTSIESFARHRYATKRFATDIGLRWSHYDHLNKAYWSPRLSMQYFARPNVLFKSSWSRVPQVVRQLYYEYLGVPNQLWIAADNRDISVLTSNNIMLGTTMIFNRFTIDVEAYYKSISGVLEYSVINPDRAENNPDKAQDYRLFNGGGRVRGIDFMLSTAYRNYNTYLIYTLSKNIERHKGINDNEFYPSEYDRRHQFKWLNTYNYKNLQLSLNSILASGRVYTDIGDIGSDKEITSLAIEDRFDRLPYYHRLDLSMSYQVSLLGKPCNLKLGVFNLLNRQNLNYQQTVSTNLQSNDETINSVIGNQANLLNRTFNLGFSLTL